MSESIPQFEVTLNESQKRFEVVIGEQLAKITYIMLGPETIIFTHTVVPFSLKGQGIAGEMARVALDYARENNLTVIPQCPFVRSYIERHPQYEDLVQKSTR
ncbi:MAG: GNAT family N-acetyltransferase [Candidatus Promineifilaceae bacterium]